MTQSTHISSLNRCAVLGHRRNGQAYVCPIDSLEVEYVATRLVVSKLSSKLTITGQIRLSENERDAFYARASRHSRTKKWENWSEYLEGALRESARRDPRSRSLMDLWRQVFSEVLSGCVVAVSQMGCRSSTLLRAL
jgi:hypothetical protein